MITLFGHKRSHRLSSWQTLWAASVQELGDAQQEMQMSKPELPTWAWLLLQVRPFLNSVTYFLFTCASTHAWLIPEVMHYVPAVFAT